jgi:ABC-type phosphate transport system substrate-binding protein
MRKPENKAPLAEFLRWMLSSGQKQSASLGYVPLPPAIAERALREVEEWAR